MKKTLAAMLFGSLLCASCSNDFEVAAPWKDIPVVYGLLDLTDTAYYIRVEKAFLDPDANALDLARIPDSFYYDNATVQIERVSTGQFFELTRVEGNDEGYPRETGIFAEEPNYLFKIDTLTLKLKSGEAIRFHLDRGNGQLPDVTAETTILPKMILRDPGGAQNFTFNYNSKTTLRWDASPLTKIFDARLIIRYAEYPADMPDSIMEKALEWEWARGLRNEQSSDSVATLEAEKLGVEFYQFLKNNIEANPVMKRVFLGIDTEIIGGDAVVEKYVNVSLANSGITGTGEIPTYTNLSEGRGLFASTIYLLKQGTLLAQTTRDSLRMGIHTKALNFQ